MKKRIGELNGMPIVVGDGNELTTNEYLLKEISGKTHLYKRGGTGLLEITVPSPVAVTSLDYNEDVASTSILED